MYVHILYIYIYICCKDCGLNAVVLSCSWPLRKDDTHTSRRVNDIKSLRAKQLLCCTSILYVILYILSYPSILSHYSLLHPILAYYKTDDFSILSSLRVLAPEACPEPLSAARWPRTWRPRRPPCWSGAPWVEYMLRVYVMCVCIHTHVYIYVYIYIYMYIYIYIYTQLTSSHPALPPFSLAAAVTRAELYGEDRLKCPHD